MSEFNGYYTHSKEFEFDLIRIQGGILDLKNALVDNWSPVRSSEAIRNFYRLVRTIGNPVGLLGKFTTSGANYDTVFPGFSKSSYHYLESLIHASWECEWPYPLYSCDPFFLAYKKITRKLGLNKNERVYLSRLSSEEFIEKTRAYFKEVFNDTSSNGSRALIINNGFEPFFPEKSIELFDLAKSIVVDRDPRDVYLAAFYAGKIGNSLVGEVVLGGSVENFIKRFKLYHCNISEKRHRDIYRLNFESLVFDYSAEVDRICKFLGEKKESHRLRGCIFSPEKSSKNIGLWRSLTNKTLIKDIKHIQAELSDYCRIL